jgi:hypothetical protein
MVSALGATSFVGYVFVEGSPSDAGDAGDVGDTGEHGVPGGSISGDAANEDCFTKWTPSNPLSAVETV